ncbi:Metalloprotease TIKI2 [Dissostichus eleginoides]|nr:Metalloprotease TIKI2 [Dissostichus eleginoides]
MACLPGFSWVFLSALLHAVAPWGAHRPDRPRQCDAPKSQSDMNSFLWRVKRAPPHPPSYLFGTIHVPYTRVWDFIPDRSKQAFHSSRNVFFELDLTDPLTISKLTNCQLLPHGESLQTLLPRDLYRRLKRHLDYVKHMMPYWMTSDQRGRGLYADYLFNAIAGNWERKRPVWVMLMINSLTEWDVRSRGTPVLDLYLAQEAERMGKTTGAVERVEEQCHPLNGLNFSQAPGPGGASAVRSDVGGSVGGTFGVPESSLERRGLKQELSLSEIPLFAAQISARCGCLCERQFRARENKGCSRCMVLLQLFGGRCRMTAGRDDQYQMSSSSE